MAAIHQKKDPLPILQKQLQANKINQSTINKIESKVIKWNLMQFTEIKTIFQNLVYSSEIDIIDIVNPTINPNSSNILSK